MYILFKNKIPSKKNNRNLSKRRNSKKWITDIPSFEYNKWNKFIIKNIKDITILENNEKDIYYYKDKKSLTLNVIFFPFNNRRFDLTNTVQSIEDTLSDIWIIWDDNFKILSNFNYKIDKSLIWINKELENGNIFAILKLTEKEDLYYKEMYNIIDKNKENIKWLNNFIKPSIKKKKRERKKVYFE